MRRNIGYFRDHTDTIQVSAKPEHSVTFASLQPFKAPIDDVQLDFIQTMFKGRALLSNGAFETEEIFAKLREAVK